MEYTLYLAEPTTGKHTRTEKIDIPDNEDPLALSSSQLWKLLGRSGPVNGSLWKPPSDEYVFVGEGWTPIDKLSGIICARHLERNTISPELVEYHGKTVETFNALVNSTRSYLDALGRKLSSKYTDAEQKTWELQASEAQKVIEGHASQLISMLAEDDDKSAEDLALIILEKREAQIKETAEFLILSNQIRGRVQEARSMLSNKKTKLQALQTLAEACSKLSNLLSN